jgi:hypothetical protein
VLGFDAVGRLALGQITPGNVAMAAISGSYTISGVAQAFSLSEATAAGAFAISGASISQEQVVDVGSFTVTGTAQTFDLTENASAAAYVITGQLSNNIDGASEAGSFTLTGVDQALIWTGAGVDTSYTGGVGHFLEEIERQKRLNAITRKIPGPVDRRTIPRFAPLQAPPSAPAAPQPDMAAIQNQRMADAAKQSAVAKRRRDEEALLLLAS